MRFLLKHPLINTLASLRGNARACVYTEPMWGLSMNLCLPYMSVFMLGIGLNDVQVGIVASIYMASQIAFAFLSGALTDKFGRRKSVAVFDAIGWSLPCIIWAFAVDFRFFLVAAVFNGAMRVPMSAWSCLLVEDAEKSKITQIYTLIMISGNLAAMFSPISSLLISRLTLVPAVRILLINAFVVMTLKIIILYALSRETSMGAARMEETKGQSYFSLFRGYLDVLRLMRRSPGLLFSVAVASLYAIIAMINTTFWQIIVSKKLDVPDSALPLYTMLRSAIALLFFFTVIAKINQQRLKNPLLLGFSSYFAGQLMLILIPSGGAIRYVLLCLSLLFDGLGAGVLVMLSEAMIAIYADETERARVLAIHQMIVMAVCAPFGWIGGLLSDISRDLPFALNLTLIAAGAAFVLLYFRHASRTNRADGNNRAT
ncbi:MAG: MFS transporter [Oscillospiraceae bacterium]|nr:MFS transporter [Oscillospiraceae bacterium]